MLKQKQPLANSISNRKSKNQDDGSIGLDKEFMDQVDEELKTIQGELLNHQAQINKLRPSNNRVDSSLAGRKTSRVEVKSIKDIEAKCMNEINL